MAKKKKKSPKKFKESGHSIISDEIDIPNHSGMLDAGKVHRTPTDDLDPVNKKYVDDFERLDGTNQPATGNKEIRKVNPEHKLTDTRDNNSTRITKSNTSAVAQRFNTAEMPGGGAGNAVDFDGADDYINITTASDLDSSPMSIAFWIKMDATMNGNAGFIIGNDDLDVGANGGWHILWDDRGGGANQTNNFGVAFHGSNTILRWEEDGFHTTFDEWVHVVVTINSNANTIQVYKNGSLRTADTTNPFDGAHTESALDLRMADSQSNTFALNGKKDEVAIWQEILSANDAADLYNSGDGLEIDPSSTWPTDGGSMGTNLSAIWHHDETAMNSAPGGADTEDSSGNGHHGTAEASMTDADFVIGIITSVATNEETSCWKSEDGTNSLEKGIQTLGDEDGRSVIEGKTIRLNTDGTERAQIDGAGCLIWEADGSGLVIGEIYAEGNDTTHTITISGEANKVQITTFNTNGASCNMSPDHTNDHITIDKAGFYMCTISITINSLVGAAANFGFAAFKNNGATKFSNVHVHRDLPAGAGGNSGSISMSGIIDCAVDDTIEAWVWNETNTQNIDIDDITMSLIQVGGT